MQLPITHISVPYTDLKPLIYAHIHNGNKNGISNPIINYTKYILMYTVYDLCLHNLVEEIKSFVIV